MRVEEIMTRDVVTVGPDEPIKSVARLLVDHGISGVPVCGRDGEVLGVVSEADILRREEGISCDLPRVLTWVARRLDGELDKLTARTAADAMSVAPITARPAQQVADVARSMVDNRINRLPVVSNGRLVGIVTRADLMRAFIRSDAEIEREIREDILFRTMLLLPDDFDLGVTDGHASIAGGVGSQEDAELLVRWVRRVPGVVDVDARLRSGPPAPRSRVPIHWS
jgi:CBS domain-containing protein